MKKYRFLFILLLMISVISVLCYYWKLSLPNHRFENFTRTIFENDVVSDTLTLHYTLADPESYGIKDYDITLGSFSDYDHKTACAAIENYATITDTFKELNLNEKNRLTCDILSDYLNGRRERLDYYLYPEIFTPSSGIHSQLPIMLAEYEFRCQKDIDDYLILLSQMDTYFKDAADFEKLRAENGLIMADFSLDKVISQCRSFTENKTSHYLASTFNTRIEEAGFLTPEEIRQYEAENLSILQKHVFPAYENLADFLETLRSKAPSSMALCYYPDGKNYYEGLVRQETGSSKTIEEIKKTLQQRFSTEFTAYADLLKEDPSMETASLEPFFDNSPVRMLSDLKEKTEKDFPCIPQTEVSVKYVDKALQDFMSPAFYMTPPIDISETNVIYINPASSYSSLNLYTTLAHEGYPGHLYQTNYFHSTNPDPIRSLLYFGGYTEGWALYTEMYSYRLAEGNSAMAQLQCLNQSIQLCLFSLMDISIHYDGLHEADIISNLARYGITDKNSAREIYRYISEEPANYLKYYMGYLEFLELKKLAQQQEGNHFNLKEFHTFLLEIGPAPFSVIRERL